MTSHPVHADASLSLEDPLSTLSLKEKIGQMLMLDFRYWESSYFTEMNEDVAAIIKEYHIGSVILFKNNIITPEQTLTLTQGLQKASLSAHGIGLIITTDQEGGSVTRLSYGSVLPGNMALGATASQDAAYQVGKILGTELQAVGINGDLAPVADVNSNAKNPIIGLRSFSDDPVLTGQMISAMIDGMQEVNLISCAKHFPGHGDTSVDSHYGLPLIDKSKDDLLNNELIPFQMAIKQDVDMIMSAHILFPQLDSNRIHSEKTGQKERLPATMSYPILTDLLKHEMGFNGIVCTDSLEMAAIADIWDPVQAAVLSINAGADMLCMPVSIYSQKDLKKLDALVQGIQEVVKKGILPESRIDDAVRRILTVKEKHGLLSSELTESFSLDTLACESHQKQIASITDASVTILQNQNSLLPLDLHASETYLLLVPDNTLAETVTQAWNTVCPQLPMRCIPYVNNLSKTVKKEIRNADTVMLFTSLHSISQMKTAPLSILEYAIKKNRKILVISTNLPYDAQLYTNADGILASYGAYSHCILNACLRAIFGMNHRTGTLPVSIPQYSKKKDTYTDSLVYEQGYGLPLSDFELSYISARSISQVWNATSPTVLSVRTKKAWKPYYRLHRLSTPTDSAK